MKRSVLLQVAAVLAVLAGSSAARANAPALAGYTGKPNDFGIVSGCNNCHNGGAAPTLTLTGPASIAVGTPAAYTLTVNTGATRGQGMVAIPRTAGTMVAVSGLTKDMTPGGVPDEELIATGTGTKTYQFTINAKAPGPFLIYYAGLAANGSGTGGDGYARATMSVTATGTAPPPDAGTPKPDGGVVVPPGTDGGAPPKVDGGGVVTPLADGGSVTTYPDGAVVQNSGTTPKPASIGPTDADGGCNASGSSLSLSGIFAAGAVATFLIGARRRSRSSGRR